MTTTEREEREEMGKTVGLLLDLIGDHRPLTEKDLEDIYMTLYQLHETLWKQCRADLIREGHEWLADGPKRVIEDGR
jgi:hypothetical protein